MVTGTAIFLGGLTFFRRNFVAILLCAVLPVIADTVLTVALSEIRMQHVIAQWQSGVSRVEVQQTLRLLTLTSAVMSILIASWFSARIYRLRLRTQFPVTSSEAGATLRVFLWSLALALIFLLALVLTVLGIVLPLSGAGAPIEFLTDAFGAQVTAGGIAGAILGVASVIYLIQVMLRFAMALPGTAIGRSGIFSAATWRQGRRAAWPLMGWLLLTGLGSMLAGILLITFAVLPVVMWGAEARPVAPEDMAKFKASVMLASSLGFMVPKLLFGVVTALTFAEGYARLNRPRG